MAKLAGKVTKIKQSPKRPAEERRRQLLSAAQHLFIKKGFRATTTEDIARQAGLTKGALYFHFRKKEDILFDLLDGMHSEVMTAFGALPPGSANPAELLKILLDKHSSKDTPEFGAFLDFWSEVMKIPRVRKHLQKCLAESDRLMVDRIDRRYGKTAKERNEIGVLVFALFDGLTVRSMMFRESVDYARQVKLFATLWQGLTTLKGKQRK